MALTPNLRGALYMTGSMTAFTLNDVFMKMVGGSYPFFQLLLSRSLMVIVLLGLLAWRMGAFRATVSRRDRWLIAARTGAEAGGAYFFLNALFNMPIANATAIIQTLPLTVPLAAAVFLKEPVGARRLTAIVVGFLGVLLIVRPGTEGFTIYSIYVLIAVCFFTARDIFARQLSPDVPSATVAFGGIIGITIFAALGATTEVW
ncbi:MAG: DMT family transporter, partial [Pseudomonadota bacterium]